MANRFLLMIALLSIMSLTGCTSIRSTMLLRTDNNSYVGNSNGSARCDGAARPFKGVPITVELPTHLDVSITETYYLFAGIAPATTNSADVAASLQEAVPSARRNLGVKAELVKTKKLFTVDFKRPAAGVLSYNAKFAGQYFDAINNKIEDRTINDTADAIATVLPKLASLTAAKKGTDGTTGSELQNRVIKGERVVAFRRFDLNSPTFEDDVEQFVNQHLNCDDCFGNPLNNPAHFPTTETELPPVPTINTMTELPPEFFSRQESAFR